MSPLLAGPGRASQPFLLAPGRAFVLINHPLGLSPPSSTRNLSLGAAPAAFWELATHWVAWRGGDPVPGGRRNQGTVLINHFCHLQTSFGVRPGSGRNPAGVPFPAEDGCTGSHPACKSLSRSECPPGNPNPAQPGNYLSAPRVGTSALGWCLCHVLSPRCCFKILELGRRGL